MKVSKFLIKKIDWETLYLLITEYTERAQKKTKKTFYTIQRSYNINCNKRQFDFTLYVIHHHNHYKKNK